jgi:hypothetical protein
MKLYLVAGVHANNLEVFVGGVLSNPVGVQHSKTSSSSANALLENLTLISKHCRSFLVILIFLNDKTSFYNWTKLK